MLKTNISIIKNKQDYDTTNRNIDLKLQSIGDVIYNKLTLFPSFLNVGTVSSEYKTIIEISNTTMSLAYLNDITFEDGEGITVVPLGEFPVSLVPGKTAQFELTISTEGPSIINAIVSFGVLGEESLSLPITGDRVAFFNFDINYSQPINEYYQHLTNISTSFNGREQRTLITENPRLAFEYYYTLIGEDRVKAETMLYESSADTMQVPVHQLKNKLLQEASIGDSVIYSNVNEMNLQNGMKLMLKSGNDYEVVEVYLISENEITLSNNLSNNYNKNNTILYPLMLVDINSSITSEYLTNDICNMLIRFEVLDNTYKNINTSNDDIFSEYDGYKVIDRRPSRDVTFRRTTQRQFDLIDNGYGIRGKTVNDKTPSTVMTYTFSLLSKEEITQTKSFFNNMKGRYNEFYVVSSTEDFKAAVGVSEFDLSIICENYNQTSFNDNLNKKILRLTTKSNEIFTRDITNISTYTDGRISVGIDSPLGIDIPLENIASIQYLERARLNNDNIQITHITDDYAEINIDVNIFRGKF